MVHKYHSRKYKYRDDSLQNSHHLINYWSVFCLQTTNQKIQKDDANSSMSHCRMNNRIKYPQMGIHTRTPNTYAIQYTICHTKTFVIWTMNSRSSNSPRRNNIARKLLPTNSNRHMIVMNNTIGFHLYHTIMDAQKNKQS